MTIRLGILISGRGSNMQSIVRGIREGSIDAQVSLVFANRPKAPGLEWAREQGLPTASLSHRDFESREAFDRGVVALLREAGTDWIALAGFMRILSGEFLGAFPDRILNIHPALLPSFPGTDTHRRALEAGVKLHGCTVHLVDEVLDGGPIVIQAAVPVRDDDTADSLAARVLIQEHVIYPRAVALAAAGRLQVEGGRVVTGGEGTGPATLVWPADDHRSNQGAP